MACKCNLGTAIYVLVYFPGKQLGLVKKIIELKILEGCQVRQSTLMGSTRETGSSYLRCTEVGT
jgi:hypothetical protein